MTEPRDPAAPEGDAVPEPNPWYPVNTEADEAPEEAGVEPVAEPVPEEAGVEPVAEPVPEEAGVEPVAEPVPEEAGVEPVAKPVPEEAGEERADRHEGPSAPQDAEPVAEPVPEEVGEERADRHEGPSAPQDAEPTVVVDATEGTVDDATAPVLAPPEDTATQRLTMAVPEATITLPEETVAVPVAPADAIFRPPSPASAPSPEPTRIEQLSEEEERLAAERAARRDARVAAFAAPVPQPAVAPAPVVVHKRTNDGFWGSLGLFLLRVLLAGVFALRGLYTLTDLPAAEAQIAKTILADVPPGPQVWAIILGVSSLLVALALLLGLLTRVAGLGIALIAGGALVLVYWGPWSPFLPGQPGFLGEYELLLTVVGLLLLFLGGGGWSLDRSFRAGRERGRRERADLSD